MPEQKHLPSGAIEWVPAPSEMSASAQFDLLDPNTNNLEDYKAAKIAALNESCEQSILGGFVSEKTGYNYSFSQYDQMNLTQQMLVVISDQTLESIDWKTEDAGIVTHTRDEFLTVCHEAEEHKRTKIAKYWELKAVVLNAERIEEVIAVKWS